MKTFKRTHQILIRSALFLSMASLTWLPLSAMTQAKGAELLLKQHRPNPATHVQKADANNIVPMSCPKCKDIWVKVVQRTAKGGQHRTATIARHQCPGCDTKIATEGVGKQAKRVVKHVCKQGGSEVANCCASHPGSGRTEVTEQARPQH